MRSTAPLIGLIALVTALYPLAVYFGLAYFQPASLALMLLGILVLRFVLIGDTTNLAQAIPMALIGGLCLVAAWFQSEKLLRYYPVLMNLCFAGLFWFSLKGDKTLIERFASVFDKKLTQHALHYMRGLTKAWAALLLVNALVSLYSACCVSFKLWAIYNGLIAYLVFAVFTLFELCYRHNYKKRHQQRNPDSEL